MIIDIILLQVIIVYCLDLSGFPEEVTSKIHSWLTNGKNKKPFMIKPIFCSRCMMFWVGIIFLLITHRFTLFSLFIVALLSWSTILTKDLLQTIMNGIEKIIELINDKL